MGRYWPVSTRNKPNAVVLFVHGSGEHCQRYRHVAQFFKKHDIPCVAYDLRGHGLSGGERGFTPHIKALMKDLELIIEYTRKELNYTMPLVIYAHGTGSVNCLAYRLPKINRTLDCQAIILNTPSVCLQKRPNPVMYFVSRSFANLSPHFRLPVKGNYTNKYTTDPAVVEAYRADPLVHDRWPARTISLFLEVGYMLETTVLDFPVPVLIQHGVADEITPIETIRRWAQERVKGNDKTFKEWPDHSHELHNDLKKEEVLDYVLDWIKQRFNVETN